MITGRLQEKNERYYMVLNLKNEKNQWRPKWIATGLSVKGNKKKAESMLREAIRKYELEESKQRGDASDILFSDFMLDWLELIRNSVE